MAAVKNEGKDKGEDNERKNNHVCAIFLLKMYFLKTILTSMGAFESCSSSVFFFLVSDVLISSDNGTAKLIDFVVRSQSLQ